MKFFRHLLYIYIITIDNPISAPLLYTTNWFIDDIPWKGICPNNGIAFWTLSLNIILIEQLIIFIDALIMI